MEYMVGKALREMLAAGALPSDKLIRYATQLAEGLAKAHQARIVHRNLKPENLGDALQGHGQVAGADH